VIYRPSGLYGRGGPRHLYLNRAIDEALDKRVPPRLVGSGAALRNYIGVEDAAAWIVHDVLSSRTHNAPVYIAGGETLPIRNWLEGITEILLDGQSLTLLPGDSGSDVLVEQTPPPVSLTPFKRYLQKLHAERVG
jgi:nucleoside-diphosphate-sugar epimerase